MQFTQDSERGVSWERLSPLLDEAMTRLRQDERDAIVLRFFETGKMREIAGAMGHPENGAWPMRLGRLVASVLVLIDRRRPGGLGQGILELC
jgi:hypothetical protein